MRLPAGSLNPVSASVSPPAPVQGPLRQPGRTATPAIWSDASPVLDSPSHFRRPWLLAIANHEPLPERIVRPSIARQTFATESCLSTRLRLCLPGLPTHGRLLDASKQLARSRWRVPER